MTPAAITLNSKYELNSEEIDKYLKRIYDNCHSEFNNSKSYIATNFGIPTSTLYKDYPQNFKNLIITDINRIIQNINQNQNFKIPVLTDKSGTVKFSHSNLTFDIDDSDGFIVYLIFTTDLITLVDKIDNMLILSLGDKLDLLNNSTTIDVFSLEYANNIWINTYKK